jgi:branched-chain amino acid transport system permease protein
MFIQNWVSSYVDRWQTLLGVVFVLVIVFAPDGIVGAWNRLVWAPLLRKQGKRSEVPAAPVAVVGTREESVR